MATIDEKLNILFKIFDLMNENGLELISYIGRTGFNHTEDGIKYEIKEIYQPVMEDRTIEVCSIPSYTFALKCKTYNVADLSVKKLNLFLKIVEDYIKTSF